MSSSRRRFLKQTLVAGGALRWDSMDCENQVIALPAFGAPNAAKFEPSYLRMEREKRLKPIEADFWEGFKSCRCCPRQCGANRLKGEKGVCSSSARLKVHAAAPHFGEEKPLVGRGGSGTIFFSNCNLLCCFCQNWQINHRGDGEFVDHDALAGMMLDLQRRGCHNLNLVTPTHVLPHIVKALRIAIAQGFRLPLVYNTGGYDNLDMVKKLDGIIDIYLPDYKYMDGKMAAKYSSGAADYPEVAALAIKEMNRQVGDLKLDDKGIAQRGLIIRHLVMPNNLAGTDLFVRWVAKELSPKTYVNIMAQYQPMYKAFDHPEIARRITTVEWQQALLWAREAGLENLDR